MTNDLINPPDMSAPGGLSHMMLNGDSMRALIDFSELMANSVVTVPKHLQGKPADCMAIAMQAAQWGMNPFAVAQKTHVVNGTLGYEAQLVNAVVQSSRAISGTFQYEFEGSGATVRCRVGAIVRGETDITWGEWLGAETVQTKNSPLWKTNPKQQLGYLQVKNWARLYCPGAILGIYSDDELELYAPTTQHMGQADEVPSGPQRKSASAPAPAATVIDQKTGEITETPPPPAAAPRPVAPAAAAPATGGISGGQVAYLRNKLKSAGVDEAAVCDRFQTTSIELLNGEQFDTLKAELLSMA